MKPKLAAARALAAYAGRRSLRFATIVTVLVLVALLIGFGLLAYYFSPWWWLFAIPVVLLGIVFFALRWILLAIIRRLYRHPFSRSQREQLDSFAGKVLGLIEARSTPLPFFAFITLWDIIRRRDATTLRKLVNDSTSLKKDFSELEKQFQER